MIRNAVLSSQTQSTPVRPLPVRPEPAAADSDVVQALVRVMNQPGHALELAPDVRTRRPFDAQYWACWLVTALFPTVLVYLWMTH